MRIGIDLGGTKIEGIALDKCGSTLRRERIATPRGRYRDTLLAIRDLVAGLETGFGGGASVGVGIPGTISPVSRLVKNANSTWLIGRPFDRDLVDLLGRPVRTANDANCFALSEARDGAAAGAASVFGVILGTGVGGGLVIEGRPLTGANAIAGEWGHNPLPWSEDGERPGPACYCGRDGCIETFLSGPALERDYHDPGMTGAGQAAATALEIAARADAGEPAAESALSRYVHRLARALAHVINLVDPEVIVLGGGLSNIERLYRQLPGQLPAFVFSDSVATRILPPRHGDSSGVRGAAWLWDDPEGACQPP